MAAGMSYPEPSGRAELRRMRIYAIVDSIPLGRISTYGRVAEEAGIPRGARQVGAALRDLPKGRVLPWHRVINAAGKISHGSPQQAHRQRKLLAAEGIRFGESDKVDLSTFVWP